MSLALATQVARNHLAVAGGSANPGAESGLTVTWPSQIPRGSGSTVKCMAPLSKPSPKLAATCIPMSQRPATRFESSPLKLAATIDHELVPIVMARRGEVHTRLSGRSSTCVALGW